ncbi:AAA family ATPase [Nocardioides montaniterrae]
MTVVQEMWVGGDPVNGPDRPRYLDADGNEVTDPAAIVEWRDKAPERRRAREAKAAREMRAAAARAVAESVVDEKAAIRFAEKVADEKLARQARAEAYRQIAEEERERSPMPTAMSLAALMARPRDPARYRVERLWSAGGRVVFAAQHKAGKTTTAINLVKSLVDGTDFLDEFAVTPVSRVAVLDFEMDADDLADEYSKLGVANDDRVDIYALRGRASSFNILDEDIRALWVSTLQGVDVVILDCLAPAASALGIDENDNTAMGKYLARFDELLAEAGIGEAVLIHHTGHDGSRARGASRILGWGDQNWSLRLDNPNEPSSARFFKAYGRRRVDVRERGLRLDPGTNRLVFDDGVQVLVPSLTNADTLTILAALAAKPSGLTQNKIESAVGWRHGGATGTRLAGLETAGLVTIEKGPRNAKIYKITPEGREAADDSAY